MPNNVYECMYILDANAYARNPGNAAESISRMVEQVDGEMLSSRLWNEQKLAYPIKGRHKGAYWLSYARIDADQLTKFNRACRLNDIVLRHLIVKIDPRLVEPLVSAAKGETKVEPPVEPVEAPASEDKTVAADAADASPAATVEG